MEKRWCFEPPFFAILEELQGGCVQAHTPAGCRLIMYLAPDVHPMGIQSGFKLFNGFSTRNWGRLFQSLTTHELNTCLHGLNSAPGFWSFHWWPRVHSNAAGAKNLSGDRLTPPWMIKDGKHSLSGCARNKKNIPLKSSTSSMKLSGSHVWSPPVPFSKTVADSASELETTWIN